MKNLLKLTVLFLVLVLMLSACSCKHESWNTATCETPKTCARCGATEGTPLGHTWLDATCEEPQTCEICGATAGASLGHTWAAATCETPKTCSLCLKTDGEVPGHTWLAATTESPKTCSLCGITEGERIITDPRFTTAATKDLQGAWIFDHYVSGEEMGMAGFHGVLDIRMTLEFRSDGTMELSATSENSDAFLDSMVEFASGENYKSLEAEGLSREEINAIFETTYHTTLEDYMRQTLASQLNLEELFASFHTSGVYYVKNGKIHIADSWQNNMSGTEYILSDNSLTLMEDFLSTGAKSTTFTRAPQA